VTRGDKQSSTASEEILIFGSHMVMLDEALGDAW
jgi:hypothetical protein